MTCNSSGIQKRQGGTRRCTVRFPRDAGAIAGDTSGAGSGRGDDEGDEGDGGRVAIGQQPQGNNLISIPLTLAPDLQPRPPRSPAMATGTGDAIAQPTA
ncbi:MAG: hypothetical protein Fur0042_02330 [Cyanophyceae cyanobacterium]